jgi:hypothetical protein
VQSMKHVYGLQRIFLGLTAVGALFAAPAKAPTPPATPSPAIVRQIDALLKHRLRPDPLPIDPPNPFVVSGGGIRDSIIEGGRVRSTMRVEAMTENAQPDANPNREAVPASNADVLAACASRLRIGGMIQMKDQTQVVINDAPRKEGDFLTVQWNNAPVHLRVVRVNRESFVIRYMDAELTLRY